YQAKGRGLRLAPKKLPRAIAALSRHGWRLEIDGKVYRQASNFQIEVRSGIDWFELHGGADFGDGLTVALPRLLAALGRGDKGFAGVKAADAAPQFTGLLRPYQRDGLGWMQFLQQFRFGGCLADDMGLGKTIQVLAMLQSRKSAGHAAAPSLIVVPRSLVFNW